MLVGQWLHQWRTDGRTVRFRVISGGASGWGVVEKLRFNSVGRWCLEITAVSNSARSGIGSWWHRGLVVRLKSGDCRSRWTGFASPILRGWRSDLQLPGPSFLDDNSMLLVKEDEVSFSRKASLMQIFQNHQLRVRIRRRRWWRCCSCQSRSCSQLWSMRLVLQLRI